MISLEMNNERLASLMCNIRDSDTKARFNYQTVGTAKSIFVVIRDWTIGKPDPFEFTKDEMRVL